MNIFKNFKVGTKIMTGYAIALALLVVVGSLAVVRLNQINTTVDGLVNDLAEEQRLAADIVEQILLSRFYALRYLNQKDPADFERHKQEFDVFQSLMASANERITDPKRVEMLATIQTGLETYGSNYGEVTTLMSERAKIVADELDAQGPLVEAKLDELRASAFEAEDAVASYYAGNAQRAFLLMRLNAFKYLEHGDTQWVDKFKERYQQAQTAFETLDVELQDPIRRRLAAEAKTAADGYYQSFMSLQADYDRQNSIVIDVLNSVGPEIRQSGAEMVDSVQADFTAEAQQTNTLVTQTGWVLIVIIGVAIVFGLGMGIAFTRMITKPLGQVTDVALAIARGKLDETVAYSSKDEVGVLADAFNRMMAYMQTMAGAATEIAQGNLTTKVSPQSAEDVLGNAFRQMILNLRKLINQVQQGANQVAASSQQLNSSADQAGQASQQVATITQQVASGTNQQAASVSEATSNVEQMARGAEGIARGAQEQAESVQRTSDLIDEMAEIVARVGRVAESVTEANAKVTQAAQMGASTVEETGQGMATIRTRSADAAEKVKEMGNRSREIGRIVETIDDIADKTDMLALNAAVEAARAGEYGRGFAVVADQVRKLSEDSKNATRDIGELIERVQQSVNEAVLAMQSTTTEVDNGSRLAGETRQSFQEIFSTAETAAQMAERIREAVNQLQQKSSGVVSAIGTVSTVVEENTAASEEMAANGQEVTQAMEGIASVAEENSASIEEVSASAEEMSAQVEEMVASAEELSALAEELRISTIQFRIEEGGWNEPVPLSPQPEVFDLFAGEQPFEPEAEWAPAGR